MRCRGRRAPLGALSTSVLVAVLLVAVPASAPAAAPASVVVVGGSPAGVAAALGAARGGAQVTLLAEGPTVGGTMSNGLGATDVGSADAVQGVAREFFGHVRSHYGSAGTWRFEPRIAERIFRRMLDEAHVAVRLDAPLAGVRTQGSRITCVGVVGGSEVCGDTFVDATYSGELIAGSGLPHRLGAADLRAHGEYLALRRGWVEVNSVPTGLHEASWSAFEANPFVRTAEEPEPYEEVFAEGRPSITYRLCVTADPENRKPFRPAPGYDEWLPSFRFMTAGAADEVAVRNNGTRVSDLFQLARLPGEKFDLNAGRLGITNVPAPEGYFDSSVRRWWWDAVLRDYVESFFHFVRTDPTVPPSVQGAFAPFGLCADEFVDNGGWPYQPYVREGRRVIGRSTFTVRDIFLHRQKPDAVALGSYHVDSKHGQIVYADGVLRRDVGAFSPAPVYEIPYSAMVPREGLENVLTPVGLSASPASYGSLRMEPQYMALGQAAGTAAALARHGRPVAALPVARVQAALERAGVTFRAVAACRAMAPAERSAEGFTARCRPLPVEPG